MAKKLSVLIPVYNEENTVAQVLDRVLNVSIDEIILQVVIVDDFSSDRSVEIIQQYIETHPDREILFDKLSCNQGKGAAIARCIELSTGDLCIIQDADLEYNPTDYGVLLEPIMDGRAEVVFGSRFLGGPHRVFFFWHYMANKFLTFLSNLVNNLTLTDMETGYKVFTRSVADRLCLTSKRFGMEPEFTVKVAKMKVPIYEVPISYSGREYSEGKKIGALDGVAALWWIFRYRLFSQPKALQK